MKKVLLAIFLGLLTYGTILMLGLKSDQALLLGMVVLLVTLWTNEGLPLGVVSLFPLILFPLFDLNEINQVAKNYSHPIIFLFLGGFLIALAFEKTRLHQVVANKMIEFFPHTPRGKIYAVMITSALLSSILSNTTITLMLMPIVLSLAPPRKNAHSVTTRFLLVTAYGASIGGVLTPIGTPPNLILLGFMEKNMLPMFSFTGWILMLTPVVAIMLIIVPYFLSMGLKDEDLKSIILPAGEYSSLNRAESDFKNEDVKEKLNPDQHKLVILLLLLVGFLLVNSRYGDFYPGLGISESIILLGFGLLLFLPGINLLEWEDTIKIPWEIIFLFGAGFSIADTLIQSGLPSESIKPIQTLGGLSPWLLIFLIALGVSMVTQVTSNTAFIAVALPILFEFSIVTGLDPQLILPVATIATSYAFMLPIATPPNAIVMSSRMIPVKSMFKFGFVVNMIGTVVLTVVAYFFWI